MKKCSLLLVTLVLFTASLFAAPVVVTWEWMLEDPKVTTFRYQIDGENPDQWIVVDSSVTSYTVKGLDGSQAYTLFLQQSYDGENFSGSAKAVSEPIFPVEPVGAVAEVESVVEEVVEPVVIDEEVVVAEVEPALVEEPVVEVVAEPVAEEIVVADAEPVVEAEPVVAEEIASVEAEPVIEAEPVVAEEIAPVEAEPVVAEAAPEVVAQAPGTEEKAKAESRFAKTITLGGSVSYLFDPISTTPPTFNTLNLEANLGLQLKNIMTFNEMVGLGVDVGLSYTPYLDANRGWRSAVTNIISDFSGVMGDFTQAVTVSAAPMLNISLGKVEADIGVGGFLTYGPEFQSPKNPSYKYIYGAFAKLGLAYQFNDWFSMGANVKYNVVLVDFGDIRKYLEAGVFMGFSF